MHLHQLPQAPRRFHVIDEITLKGEPSVQYGVVRRLAYEQRKARKDAYARVLFGDAGRKGNPWGALKLEINGDVYHFNAGVKRWPEFHDRSGNLTPSGEEALASGVPGNLTSASTDWRWIHDEEDLTEQVSSADIQKISHDCSAIVRGTVDPPMFQAKTAARRLGLDIPLNSDFHNCTTFILTSLRETRLKVNQVLPLRAFDELKRLIGDVRSPLDDELNALLTLSEEEIDALLQSIAIEWKPEWKSIASGTLDAPGWLQWKDLVRAAFTEHL